MLMSVDFPTPVSPIRRMFSSFSGAFMGAGELDARRFAGMFLELFELLTT